MSLDLYGYLCIDLLRILDPGQVVHAEVVNTRYKYTALYTRKAFDEMDNKGTNDEYPPPPPKGVLFF